MMNDPSLHVTNIALHFLSTISSVIMLILLLCIRCMNSKRSFWTEYTTVFYLLLALVWSYFMENLILLIYDYTPFPCNVSDFLQLWLSNQSTMLSSAFALLLLRSWKLSFLYWSIPCFLSLVLALISSLAFYTNGSDLQCFWYDNGNRIESLIIYLIPQLLCIFFNIGVIFYILVVKAASAPASYLMYPLLPLVSQLGSVFNQAMLYTTKTQHKGLGWWACISNDLDGLVLLVVFLMDPVFWQGLDIAKCTSVWNSRKRSPGDENTFVTDDTSSDNDMIKTTMKTDSMASSMTTRTSTLTTPDPVYNANTIKEKEDIATHTNLPKQQRPFYQPLLSPHRRDAPIIIFPPPPTVSPTRNVDHPTSIELDESDFIGMFSKPASLHVDTTFDTASPGMLSPPSPAHLLPVCYELEDAVPWRVLEADEEDDHHESICIQQNDSDVASDTGATPKPTTNSKPPRHSSLSASTSGYRKESWLSLYDDDRNDAMDMHGGLYDEEKANPHHSFTSSSAPSTVSEWLTRRGDSFDGVREQMGRTSKSIRRWCRNVNKPQDDATMDPIDRYDDGARPTLHVVHEEQFQ